MSSVQTESGIQPIRWHGHQIASKPSASARWANSIAFAAGGMIRPGAPRVTRMKKRLPTNRLFGYAAPAMSVSVITGGAGGIALRLRAAPRRARAGAARRRRRRTALEAVGRRAAAGDDAHRGLRRRRRRLGRGARRARRRARPARRARPHRRARAARPARPAARARRQPRPAPRACSTRSSTLAQRRRRVAVCIASLAGHRAFAAEYDELLADPLAPDLYDRLDGADVLRDLLALQARRDARVPPPRRRVGRAGRADRLGLARPRRRHVDRRRPRRRSTRAPTPSSRRSSARASRPTSPAPSRS